MTLAGNVSVMQRLRCAADAAYDYSLIENIPEGYYYIQPSDESEGIT